MANQAAIRLSWCRRPNFGDALSRYIVERIAGVDVVAGPPGGAGRLLAIGSIVGLRTLYSNDLIWGSGCMGPLHRWRGKLFPATRYLRDRIFLLENLRNKTRARAFALRGPLTGESVARFGVADPGVYGDPAILLPRFIQAGGPSRNDRGRIGLVVHHSQEKLLAAPGAYRDMGIEIIGIVRDTDAEIEAFVREITACERILTSSLHALIVAQVYGVPCLWLQVRTKRIHRYPSFKFHDYFLGSGQEAHAPAVLGDFSPKAVAELSTRPCLAGKPSFGADALLNVFPNREIAEALAGVWKSEER